MGVLCWQGIVGGTYDRYLEGESAVSKPESQLYLPPDVSFHVWHHVFVTHTCSAWRYLPSSWTELLAPLGTCVAQ